MERKDWARARIFAYLFLEHILRVILLGNVIHFVFEKQSVLVSANQG